MSWCLQQQNFVLYKTLKAIKARTVKTTDGVLWCDTPDKFFFAFLSHVANSDITLYHPLADLSTSSGVMLLWNVWFSKLQRDRAIPKIDWSVEFHNSTKDAHVTVKSLNLELKNYALTFTEWILYRRGLKDKRKQGKRYDMTIMWQGQSTIPIFARSLPDESMSAPKYLRVSEYLAWEAFDYKHWWDRSS